MSQIRPLRKETTPIDGESARGLFCRALGDHRVPLSFTVLRRLGMQYRNVVTISEDEHLDVTAMARVIRVDPFEIEMRRYEPLGRKRYSFYGLELPSSAIEKKVRRFSPAALASSPHIRAIWELRDIPFCPETWEILVETCVCRVRQGWIRLNGVHRCDDCGRPLSRVPTNSVPPGMRGELSLIAGVASPIASVREDAIAMLPERLRGADRTAIYRSIMLLRRALAGEHPTAEADLEALHRACAAMLAWPAGIAGIAPAVKALTLTWRAAMKSYADLAPSTAADGKRPSRRATGPAPGDPIPAAEQDDGDRLIGIRPAYDLARLTPETMLAARDHGHLPRHEKLRAGKPVPAFKPDEVIAFADAYRARTGPNAVGYEFGLGRRAVCEIAVLGHMTATGVSLRDDQVWFTDEDIDALRTALIEGQTRALIDAIPLSDAMMTVSGRPKPWGQVVGAMLDGSLPFIVDAGEAPLFDRVRIERRDVAIVGTMSASNLADPRISNRVTQGEALEILNAKATCRALTRLRSTGTNPAFYDLGEVVELAVESITVLEVAKTTGRTFSSAYAAIASAGVDAVADGLWSRRQVADLFGIQRYDAGASMAQIPTKYRSPAVRTAQTHSANGVSRRCCSIRENK